MSKKILYILCCIIMCGSFSMYAQQDNAENQLIEASETFDEASISLDVSPSVSQPEKSSSTFFLLVRMVFVLACVVACIYFVFRLMKKTMAVPANDDVFMRVVSSVNLAPGKSVQIVTLTDKYAFMVGVSEDSVSLISQIDDLELVQAMNLYSDKQKKVEKPKSFADILDIFMPGGPRNEENVFDSSKNAISELLKKQRNKLNSGE